VATRGLSVNELNDCSLWWHGPSWLDSNHLSQLIWNLSEITPECLEEIRKSNPEITIVTGVDGKCDKDVFLLGVDKPCYSSMQKLLRISVYILRFIKLKVWNKLQEETRRKHQNFHLLSTRMPVILHFVNLSYYHFCGFILFNIIILKQFLLLLYCMLMLTSQKMQNVQSYYLIEVGLENC